jgi:hypothetical protein
MANYFVSVLGSSSVSSLYLEAVSKGDAYIYMRIAGTEEFIMRPTEKVKAMIAPYDTPLASGIAISLLKQPNIINDVSNGYFFFDGGENNSKDDDILSFSDLKIPNEWENSRFNLYWLHTIGNIEAYGNNTDGVYSFPHNIQPSEVVISGNLLSSNLMSYKISLIGIANDGDSNYGSPPTDGPYSLNVSYKWPNGVFVPGFENTVYYGSGVISSGINIQLPYYDARDGFNNVPAIYTFDIANVSAGTIKPGSNPINITLDHSQLIDNTQYFKNLDEFVFSKAEKDKLKRVGEIPISKGIIDRKRLSIGINDIVVKDHTYTKQGTYVSIQYPLDFQAYTFSLRVKEMIPEYSNLNPYDLIKYYIEFNNSAWQRISPIERGVEYENDILVPKMFIFDKPSNEFVSQNIKFLNYGSLVTSFRVKITFDLSRINEAKFPPPEIRNYKCIIYDKSQFFDL